MGVVMVEAGRMVGIGIPCDEVLTYSDSSGAC